MIEVLQHISPDRVILWAFAAGTLYAQFKSARSSLRDQGRRIGALVEKVVALEARVAALEASGKRA
jgi:hypothetical protein